MEYNDYSLLRYEGEYLNGKRNGKGKEYYEGTHSKILKFQGEFLNGLKWNGIWFNKNGKILYEIKDGKGIIKECYGNGNIKYEVEFLNGEKNGKVKEYYNNGKLLFEGKYLNDLKWEGKGYDKNNKIIYEIKGGKGFMKEYELGELEFEGEYINGKRNGKGKEFNLNGRLKFEGEMNI